MSESAGITLFDFRNPEGITEWKGINDVVMGGKSTGAALSSGDGSMLFQGEVSLARGGGFASIRSAPGTYPLEGSTELVVRLRGDGRRYKLSLRTDPSYDGISYQTSFQASPEWEDLSFPFRDFLPTWHGRVISDADPLDQGRIRAFGFLIADGREGPFRLEVASIGAR